jgi:hypothetical protein
VLLTKESEFVKNARSKSAQHGVPTVNNFYARRATQGCTKREPDKNINVWLLPNLQNLSNPVKQRVLVQALVLKTLKVEIVSPQEKILLIPTISLIKMPNKLIKTYPLRKRI